MTDRAAPETIVGVVLSLPTCVALVVAVAATAPLALTRVYLIVTLALADATTSALGTTVA